MESTPSPRGSTNLDHGLLHVLRPARGVLYRVANPGDLIAEACQVIRDSIGQPIDGACGSMSTGCNARGRRGPRWRSLHDRQFHRTRMSGGDSERACRFRVVGWGRRPRRVQVDRRSPGSHWVGPGGGWDSVSRLVGFSWTHRKAPTSSCATAARSCPPTSADRSERTASSRHPCSTGASPACPARPSRPSSS